VRRRFAALAFFALIAPGGLGAQPSAADLALLAAAGVEFPEHLGGLDRVEVRGDGPDQLIATYVSPGQTAGAPVATILVGRASIPAESELSQTQASLSGEGRRVTAIRDLPAPRGAPGALGRLWRLDEGQGSALIGAVIWHRDSWRIRIRGVAAADAGDAGERGWAEIQRLIDAFDWGRAPRR